MLEHGEFVSTYKFALLQALADLCIECDPGSDGTLRIPLTSIAAKFVASYWGQSAPFHLSDGNPAVLRQNAGAQIVVISRLLEIRDRFPTFNALRSSGGTWRTLLTLVAGQIRAMPLFRLQTVGRRQTELLYPNKIEDGCVVLHKGVQDCFRRFYGIVVRLVRREWLDMARRLNPGTTGAPLDLAEFLFGSERNLWAGMRGLLRELQGGRCFYCRRSVPAAKEEMDHFIPWSLYPNDLTHNFVPACPRCNRDKSDELAADRFLDQWIERNRVHGAEIEAKAVLIGLPADANASARVAMWAYHRDLEAPRWEPPSTEAA